MVVNGLERIELRQRKSVTGGTASASTRPVAPPTKQCLFEKPPVGLLLVAGKAATAHTAYFLYVNEEGNE